MSYSYSEPSTQQEALIDWYEQQRTAIDRKEQALRKLCFVGACTSGTILFFVLEGLWFLLPLGDVRPPFVIGTFFLVFPGSIALIWYLWKLFIDIRVADMLYAAASHISSPSPSSHHVKEEVRQERSIESFVPTPAEVDSLDIIPATFREEREKPYYPHLQPQ